MNSQAKFEQLLSSIAARHGYELIIDHDYSNVGRYTISHPTSFVPVWEMSFGWQNGSLRGRRYGGVAESDRSYSKEEIDLFLKGVQSDLARTHRDNG